MEEERVEVAVLHHPVVALTAHESIERQNLCQIRPVEQRRASSVRGMGSGENGTTVQRAS